MKVFIFRGKGDVYGFSKEKSGSNLPALNGPWTSWVHQREIDLLQGQKRIALDVGSALKNISESGYYLHEVKFTFEVIPHA